MEKLYHDERGFALWPRLCCVALSIVLSISGSVSPPADNDL